MTTALIVFGSTTGNTEATAEMIENILKEKGVDVTVKNVVDAKVGELGKDYDLTVLGSSTWGDDEIEFQEDFQSFYDELDDADLKDKKVALFGCGDSSYEYFCGAVDLLEDKMKELNAKLVNEPLRIDGEVDDAEDEIQGWATEICSSI